MPRFMQSRSDNQGACVPYTNITNALNKIQLLMEDVEVSFTYSVSLQSYLTVLYFYYFASIDIWSAMSQKGFRSTFSIYLQHLQFANSPKFFTLHILQT